jgi:hypothetical protein
MGVPIIALIVGSARLASAVVDPYLLFPDPVVNIQDTKNSSVNLTLSDFATIAQQNRLAYNAIMPMLKANTTLSEYNILLRGLEAARAKSEAGSPPLPLLQTVLRGWVQRFPGTIHCKVALQSYHM